MCGKKETHLFQGKYVLVEIKLDLLICNVDAQLLKWVLLEVFKPKDVQDSHIHAALSGTSKKKRGTNKLILLCWGDGKSPATILIDKTLMIIHMQPKYWVWSERLSLTRRNIYFKTKCRQCEWFYLSPYWFNLKIFSISAGKQYTLLHHSTNNSHPAFYIKCPELLLSRSVTAHLMQRSP